MGPSTFVNKLGSISMFLLFLDSRESSLELIVLKPNFDRISLHPICRFNNVTMETFIIENEPNKIKAESGQLNQLF